MVLNGLFVSVFFATSACTIFSLPYSLNSLTIQIPMSFQFQDSSFYWPPIWNTLSLALEMMHLYHSLTHIVQHQKTFPDDSTRSCCFFFVQFTAISSCLCNSTYSLEIIFFYVLILCFSLPLKGQK